MNLLTKKTETQPPAHDAESWRDPKGHFKSGNRGVDDCGRMQAEKPGVLKRRSQMDRAGTRQSWDLGLDLCVVTNSMDAGSVQELG